MEMPKALQITPQEILERPYERVLIPEKEGGFSAYIAEFEGCFAQGETADEALTALNATAVAWIEAEQEAGKDIPEAWNAQEFSGRLLLRLPKSLHQQLARLAEKEGVSLNQYLVSRLSATMRDDVVLAALKQLGHQTQVVTTGPSVSRYGRISSGILTDMAWYTAISEQVNTGSMTYKMKWGDVRKEGHSNVRD